MLKGDMETTLYFAVVAHNDIMTTTMHDDLRQTKIVENSFPWHALLEYINNAY